MITPCIKVCSIDKSTGMCYGCYRKVDEIARWSTYSGEQRKIIMEELKSRKYENFPDKAPEPLPKGQGQI